MAADKQASKQASKQATLERERVAEHAGQAVKQIETRLDTGAREIRSAARLLASGLAIDNYLATLREIAAIQRAISDVQPALIVAASRLGERNVRIAEAAGVSEATVSRLLRDHREDWEALLERAARNPGDQED